MPREEDAENRRLREEVRELREDLRRLTLRVDRQADELSSISSSVQEQSSLFERSHRGSGTSGFDVVSSIGVSGQSEASSAAAGSEARPARGAAAYTADFRSEVAREIGAFLRRSLNGEHRGESGRDKVKGLQNRCYLICKDYSGRTYNPVLVVEKFARVRELCKRGDDLGDSIFIGLPSYGEASIAAAAAGLQWPAPPE